jgi:hypothetical protein
MIFELTFGVCVGSSGVQVLWVRAQTVVSRVGATKKLLHRVMFKSLASDSRADHST